MGGGVESVQGRDGDHTTEKLHHTWWGIECDAWTVTPTMEQAAIFPHKGNPFIASIDIYVLVFV